MIPSSATDPGKQVSRPERRDISGIVLLDKASGISSNRALQQVKRLYQARKAGHTGSLDPLASGMLPVCLGNATRVSAWLLEADKIYEVTAAIGARTDTADADGQVVEQSAVTAVTESALQAALAAHLGAINQVPPMYSALKHQGQRLYRLARAGQEVVREPRPVFIYALELIEFDPQRPRLRVHCSKGTYVRSLVESVAAAMGTLAYVQALRRTGVGPFDDPAAMLSFNSMEVLAAADPAGLDRLLRPVDSALQGYLPVELTAGDTVALQHGRPVMPPATMAKVGDVVRLYGPTEAFLGLGEVRSDGWVVPRRLFCGAAGQRDK